ncbi:MAG TPA: hypothetical protein VL633_01045 [Bacteroidota bacterium]|jgi:hypothetical protein|nr:hypothetical protein [Bacteroidota bacterium]
MSLKSFHIAFIIISTLCAFGFGGWLLVNANGNGMMYLGAAAAMVAGIGLIVYGIRFLKKLKNVSYL